ncbi:MAG: ATP-binding cassette domain-containing protein [Kocuria sp.]|uniref:ATP-binding cassette domain-containing protein n=1 Tax=Kocuria TaxID=57493 RepID=UPI0026DCF99C|nr:ATP-binding cassette domain-containing protein [Kocuria sp.]MDO4255902.1 ATP-binding cassette domain-containing protein [Kocuria sp.]
MNTIDHLNHAYGTHVVFQDARIELPDVGTVALRGPNGCGKTTLLKLLGGVIRAQSPAVTTWRNSHHATYLDTEYLTLEHLTVNETLNVLAPLMAPDGDGGHPLVDGSMAGTRVGDLSLGQRQRLVLTIALGLKGPQVLLLDEPLNGLDARACALARRLISANGRDRLVLLATHEEDRWTDYDLVVESVNVSHLCRAEVTA